MSEGILVAVIMSVSATITSVLSYLASRKNGEKIEEVHKATNSMKDALVAAALIQGKAEGIEEERIKNLTNTSLVEDIREEIKEENKIDSEKKAISKAEGIEEEKQRNLDKDKL